MNQQTHLSVHQGQNINKQAALLQDLILELMRFRPL